MIKGITEMKSELCEALYEDLGRCRNQSEVSEITGSINSAKHDLKHIDSVSFQILILNKFFKENFQNHFLKNIF